MHSAASRSGSPSPARSATSLYARYFLRRAGADPERDASLVAIGDGTALLAALRTRQIQGYVLSAPTPQIAEREGFGTILIRPSQGDVPELTDFAAVVLVTGQQHATRNPEQVSAFLAGLTRARRMVVEAARSAPVRGVVQKYFPGMTDEVLAISLDDILPALSPDGRLSEPMIRRTLEVLVDTGQIPGAWRAAPPPRGICGRIASSPRRDRPEGGSPSVEAAQGPQPDSESGARHSRVTEWPNGTVRLPRARRTERESIWSGDEAVTNSAELTRTQMTNRHAATS